MARNQSSPTRQVSGLLRATSIARKEADRAELASMPPDAAQAAVEMILPPRLWRIADPEQLSWPGDWADEEKGD